MTLCRSRMSMRLYDAALRAGAAATHGTMALKFYDAAGAPPTA